MNSSSRYKHMWYEHPGVMFFIWFLMGFGVSSNNTMAQLFSLILAMLWLDVPRREGYRLGYVLGKFDGYEAGTIDVLESVVIADEEQDTMKDSLRARQEIFLSSLDVD